MRVALLDDAVLFRSGLAALLREVGVEVTHQAADEAGLLAGLAASLPDVAVLDIRLTSQPGTEGLRAAVAVRARHPGVGILLLSAYAAVDYALGLLQIADHGVGYLVKDRVGDVEVLQDALERVAAGQTVIDPELVGELMARRSRRPTIESLSVQERNVLRLMAEGRSNQGVAGALHLSPKTIEKYILSIFRKLDLEQQEHDNRRVLAVLRWLQG